MPAVRVESILMPVVVIVHQPPDGDDGSEHHDDGDEVEIDTEVELAHGMRPSVHRASMPTFAVAVARPAGRPERNGVAERRDDGGGVEMDAKAEAAHTAWPPARGVRGAPAQSCPDAKT